MGCSLRISVYSRGACHASKARGKSKSVSESTEGREYGGCEIAKPSSTSRVNSAFVQSSFEDQCLCARKRGCVACLVSDWTTAWWFEPSSLLRISWQQVLRISSRDMSRSSTRLYTVDTAEEHPLSYRPSIRSSLRHTNRKDIVSSKATMSTCALDPPSSRYTRQSLYQAPFPTRISSEVQKRSTTEHAELRDSDDCMTHQ